MVSFTISINLTCTKKEKHNTTNIYPGVNSQKFPHSVLPIRTLNQLPLEMEQLKKMQERRPYLYIN